MTIVTLIFMGLTLYLFIHSIRLTLKYDNLFTRVHMLYTYVQTLHELDAKTSETRVSASIYDQNGTLIFGDDGMTEPVNIDSYVVDTEDTNAPSGRAREGSQS